MINFIFVMTALLYFFLIIALYTKDYPMGIMTSMGIMITGVYITLSGMGGLDNLLSQAIAVINIVIGGYILVKGTTEKVQEIAP